jgi:hypothetical protein
MTIATIATIKTMKIRSFKRLPGFFDFDVTGAYGRIEVIAPGSWRFLPQVAQSHAMGSTSQPHSAQ